MTAACERTQHSETDSILDRVPPQDREAEEAVLGSIMRDNACLPTVAEVVCPESFYSRKNGIVFAACVDLHADRRAVDLITLRDELERVGKLDDVGGIPYLAEIRDAVPSASNAVEYARIVAERARQRKALSLCLSALREAQDGRRPVSEIARETSAALAVLSEDGPREGAVVRRASDIEPKAVDWLWRDRVPRGKLTLLIGNAGLGKSLLTADMAAGLSRGATWPDGAPCAAGVSILLSGEDDAADTTVPRLKAAGAILDRIHILDGIRERDPETGAWRVTLPALNRDADKIRRAIEQTGARLIVVDPISSFIGAIDDHRNAELRGLLSQLGVMASETGCAILAVTHIRKSGGPAVTAAVGSLAYAAAARAAWALVKDPDDGSRRLFLPVKANLAPDLGGLAFRIDTDRNGLPLIAWQSGRICKTADDVLNPEGRGPGRPPLARDEAAEWLREALAAGPRPAKEVIAEAQREGIPEPTLRRAKDALGVKAEKNRGQLVGAWVWRLAEED